MDPIMDLAVKVILREYGDDWSYHFYLRQSYKCFCLFVICVYSSIVVKFLCGAHPYHHGAARKQRKLNVTLFIMTISYRYCMMWLPYAATTSFFIFNLVVWNFFLTRNIWFPLQYSLTFLYLMNSLVNPIVYTISMPEFVQESFPGVI